MSKSKPSRTIVTVQLSTEAAQRIITGWKTQDPRLLRWLAYYGLKVEEIVPSVCTCFSYPSVVDADCPVHHDEIFESGGNDG